MKAFKVYERLDFERGKDPKEAMGIGQNRIKQKLIDLFPRLSPGDADYDIHKNIIKNVILRPDFVASTNKEGNIIIKNKSEFAFSAFQTLFDLMIDHINRYSFPAKPKIARINDPMGAAKGIIEIEVF